jgi:hypothetical protein
MTLKNRVKLSLYAALKKWKRDFAAAVSRELIAGEITPDVADELLRERDSAYRLLQIKVPAACGIKSKRWEKP